MEGNEDFEKALGNLVDDILANMKHHNLKSQADIDSNIDILAKTDINFRCLKYSRDFNRLDTKILSKLGARFDPQTSEKYINLIGQITKILLDFEKEYLGDEK